METAKIYSKNAISIGTLFFGPLAGGYMLMKNFTTLQDIHAAKKTRNVFIVAMLIWGIYLLLPFQLPSYVEKSLPILYTLIIYQYAVSSQGLSIDKYIQSGGKEYSGGKVLVVSCSALLVTIVYVVAVILLASFIL